MKKIKSLILIFIITSLFGCQMHKEEINNAKELIKKRDYIAAINLLEPLNTKTSKELLANAYIENGIGYLRDKESKQKEKYSRAKTEFEKAISADPKNQTAKDLLEMISKVE